MAVTLLTDSGSTTIAPNGADGETVKFFSLDGTPPPVSGLTTATFIATDDATITADAKAAANFANPILTPGAGGFIEENLTAGTAPVIVDKANFGSVGLGVVTEHVEPPSATADFLVNATTPDAFVLTGSGNDVLIASGGGPNILDGGSGSNMFFSNSPNNNGATTYIADATTANTTDLIANMKPGDNVIVAGSFASISAGVGLSGLEFDLAGFNGAPSAAVTLGNIKAAVNLNLSFGFDTNNATGQDYFFIHRTS